MPQRIRLFTTEYGKLPNNVLLTGPRGCGKSTFLLHHSGGRHILYFSADNPKVIGLSLYELVSGMFMLGYDGVIIDEIRYATNWSIHLKALYDDFPGKTIWVSDSSSLVPRTGEGDLSRRYVPIRMPLMSFREFLYLETGKKYSKYKLGDTTLPVQPNAKILNAFFNYRQYGTRPFYSEGDFNSRYMAVMDKVLGNDIPFFLPSITDNNLRLMRAIIGTLSNSNIPRVQVTSLCSDWGIGAEKLYQLLFVMESVELLRIVRYPNDTKARSTGAKVLFADPCAYAVLNANQGTEREAFIVNCLSRAGFSVNASRDERKGDYIISRAGNSGNASDTTSTVEIGGKSKKPKEADIVFRDNTDYPAGNSVPFWLAAMMW